MRPIMLWWAKPNLRLHLSPDRVDLFAIVRVIRSEASSLGEIGQGPVEVALGLTGEAAAVVGGGVLGVEPDGLVVVGDRPVEVALGLTGEAAVDSRRWRPWGRAGWPGRSRRSPRRSPCGRSGRCRGCVGGGVLGVEPDGLVEVGDRPVEVALGLRAMPRLL